MLLCVRRLWPELLRRAGADAAQLAVSVIDPTPDPVQVAPPVVTHVHDAALSAAGRH